ncbi:glucan biosynthesis protein D [Thalassobaculum sp.]|uniref:glucan biosynthesis protein n=1 Tax=Thalassobaculum sp. TaxID=2022740 RepID=UPI0032EDBE1D
MPAFDRRSLLQLLLAAGTARLVGGPASAMAANGLKLGGAAPFSYEWLKQHARDLAGQPYQEPPRPDPGIVAKIDYDAHGKLRYRKEFALHRDDAFPISFQHVGMFFPKTVRMHAIDGANAREVLYDPTYFTVGQDHVAAGLSEQPSAFAGFWVHEPARKGDLDKVEPWATFLGASYFRGVGELGQVGLSARGIALAPGAPGPEEFPDFVSYWFEPAGTESEPVTVYALLHGPSVAGAYRFKMHRTSGVVMDIEASVHPRKSIERLGLAPLTSMYWFSETAKPSMVDWRPEVHDSDGLALWTGAGERIWRPLNNPGRTMISSFLDENPRGFGLSQRDRNFDHYLDGVKYDKRPSAWVEPLGDWGKGVVQLVEIPTDDEIHDNICAMWVPDAPHGAGSHIEIAYRLHWLADEPYPGELGRCVATRMGNGGQPGQPRPKAVRKFMVEFLGGPLKDLPMGVLPEAILTTSRGEFSYTFTEAVPDDVPGHWRAQFDLAVDGDEPVNLRCYLRSGDTVLTETWLYQYHPTPTA